jgi:hypothetical protein
MVKKRYKTAEQKEADAVFPAWYRRKYRNDDAEEVIAKESLEQPSCEELREKVMKMMVWLRGQAEALRQPLTHAKRLVEPMPLLYPQYSGMCFEDLMAEVGEIGLAVKAHLKAAKRRAKGKK